MCLQTVCALCALKLVIKFHCIAFDCLITGSDYHFHRRDTDYPAAAGSAPRWSDKNGAAPTRCCWTDPAIQDQKDAGAHGIQADEFEELSNRRVMAVVIAAEACTPPDNYLYSQPIHLMTAENGGISPHNCAV